MMGFITSSDQGWGRRMGFLLIFFPEDSQNPNPHTRNKFTRTNSIQFLYKSQFTISIFLLLIFTTVLLFLLATLPSSSTARRLYAAVPRRHLRREFPASTSHHALQRMGILYRRGVRAMNDVIVAHATESLTHHDLTLFVRLFFRSSLASRSDLIFIFPTRSSAFDEIILQENASFLKLLSHYTNKSSNTTPSFDVTPFTKLNRKDRESSDSIWGRRGIRSNFSAGAGTQSTRTTYGSVVGFDAEELDPVNSLSGFMDHVPMSLRRWACYPMLLGRVRRNFKHVMLVDVKEFLLLGDPLSRVRSHRPETVLLKVKNVKTHPTRTKPVNPGVITGGSRGIRRLSNEMLTTIVRAAVEQQQLKKKKKNPFTESGLFNQLVGSEYVLKNVNLVVTGESVPELSSVTKSGLMKNYSMIRRGYNSNFDIDSVIMKHICSFPEDSTVYSGC